MPPRKPRAPKRKKVMVTPPELPGLRISINEVVDEANSIIDHVTSRLTSLDGDERAARKVAQLFAVGILFTKWLEESPEDLREYYISVVDRIAESLSEEGKNRS